MQNNHRILQLLVRKITGEITTDELSELNHLLEMYPDALYYEEILRQLWLTQPPADEEDMDLVYDNFISRFEQDFEPQPAQPAVSWQRNIARYLVAAMVLLAVGTGLMLAYYHSTTNSQTALTEIIAGKGIRKNVTLPDGTKVWLNSNSKLTFNNNLTNGATRQVKLEGEGFFDVKKDKHHPFIISTSKFSIRVLGTAFNVRAYQNDHIAETALIRGLIELTVAGQQAQKILLKPHEKLTIADNNAPGAAAVGTEKRQLTIESITPVEIESQQYIQETSWINDKLVFKNERFDELVPRLERWYNVKIRLNNKAVNAYHFTGILQNETIDQALKAMQLIRPFNFKINEDEIIIN